MATITKKYKFSVSTPMLKSEFSEVKVFKFDEGTPDYEINNVVYDAFQGWLENVVDPHCTEINDDDEA